MPKSSHKVETTATAWHRVSRAPKRWVLDCGGQRWSLKKTETGHWRATRAISFENPCADSVCGSWKVIVAFVRQYAEEQA